MSYINDALRKAQMDRDSRYERFGGIIASGPVGRKKSGKWRLVIGAAIALSVLVSTGLLAVVYFLQQPSPVMKGSPPPVVSENDKTTSAPVPGEKGPVTIPTVTTAGGAVQGEAAAVLPGGLPNQREAEIRYLDALTAQRRGDHKRAEGLYQQAITLNPGHVRALNNLGVLFMEQKKKEPAIALFSRAISQKKDYVDPYYNLACLYARADEIDESLGYLRIAMAINGDVKNWAEKDADMKNVVASEAFKKIMEGQKH